MRGEHDDRLAVAVATQALHRLASVEIGKTDVHDDKIGRRVGDDPERPLGRVDGLELEFRMQSKLLDKRIAQVGVVVDDQYSPCLTH